ncbi:MAG: PEP-CTERM sorting domain-containing protein [Acidobacteria bacterium]|nr:PEP-CTERM sorting domain-containing protein [Acidobacteriota bacterium]
MKRIVTITVLVGMLVGLASMVHGSQIVALSSNATDRVQAYDGDIGLLVNAPLPFADPLDIAAGNVNPGNAVDEVVTVHANGTMRIGNIDTGVYVHQIGAFPYGGDPSRVAVGDVDLAYPGKEIVTRTFYTGPTYKLVAYRVDPTGPSIALDVTDVGQANSGLFIANFEDVAAGELDSTIPGDEIVVVSNDGLIRTYNLIGGSFVNSVNAFAGQSVAPYRVSIGDVDLTKSGGEIVTLGLNTAGTPILQVYNFLDPTEGGYDIFLDFGGGGIGGALDVAVGEIDPYTPGAEIVVARDITVTPNQFLVFNVNASGTGLILNTQAMAALGAEPFALSIAQVLPVPEPSITGLLGFGALVVAWARRRRV